jgi:hypothetical protein
MSNELGSLEQDVNVSRARFDESLTELQRRLAPAGLADEALGLVGVERADQLRQAARSLVAEHPIPLLFVGSGLALLLYEMARRRRDGDIDWYSAAGLRPPLTADGSENTGQTGEFD